jgi:hypothetical protein
MTDQIGRHNVLQLETDATVRLPQDQIGKNEGQNMLQHRHCDARAPEKENAVNFEPKSDATLMAHMTDQIGKMERRTCCNTRESEIVMQKPQRK